ncbi:hypothetical protein [Microcoleus sp. FACHB-1515]|uniref:hypothetical protein n=1 Tax=Microcoleus sp. FACHB-1515 TaxID=2692821 RepID=UPI0018F01417|nr:hypothetical protein [Microcoleus sp. FACHB-1515]
MASRLYAERRRQFVGRIEELNLFRSILKATEMPVALLHIFGPGGVGKTTLLKEFIDICNQLQIRSTYLDSRSIEPTSDSFLAALGRVLDTTENPVAYLNQFDRQVIFIDTYETLFALDRWLHETFLPQLSANTLVVLASRQPPAIGWRIDPGWQALIRSLPLRNLNSEESRTYLSRRSIPFTQHQAVLDFTYGHPLALSLIADVFAQKQDLFFQPEAAPDVVKTLLERFVEEVPSPAHRMALEACALVRLTTETLLAKMLDLPDVHSLFEWLRGLSFIELGSAGIFPHDLVREVLIADVRWRNPDWYIELHSRARRYYTTRLGQTQGHEQHRVLFDYIFLHRDNPAVRPRFTWQETSSLKIDRLQERDRSHLLEMVTKHEGETSANLAAHWMTKQPEGVLICRDAQHQPVGFILTIALHQASAEDLQVDPATAAAWRYLTNHAPLRSGEGATFFRFWMAHDSYQAVSPIQSLIFITFVQYHRNTAGLAYTFFACAEPEEWAAMFAYADLTRLPEADFIVGSQRYGVYGHDWRVTPPDVWQELLAQREIAASQAALPAQVTEPLVVLSQSDFAIAVKTALGQLAQPDMLAQSPLLRSRLVVEQSVKADKSERVVALQNLLRSAIESLQSSPREAKLYRALDHSYLQPAPTQEKAAERLDLPFSTFRRHLKAGITRVTEILWFQETGRLE